MLLGRLPEGSIGEGARPAFSVQQRWQDIKKLTFIHTSCQLSPRIQSSGRPKNLQIINRGGDTRGNSDFELRVPEYQCKPRSSEI
jgi:hypothetical protein